MKYDAITRRALLGGLAAAGITLGPGMAFAKSHRLAPIQRAFSDPYLELIRLLKEGAEIEQDLMVQYMYSAFSIKPEFAGLVGDPVPGASSLMGVVIQEMQHLGQVNRLLVELDAKPVLTRLDYPYESDIYPFAFELAPMSAVSLAKYTFVEADQTRLGHVRSKVNDSQRLIDRIRASLGGTIAANHVGELYDAIIDMLGEVRAAGGINIDFGKWMENIGNVKADGEFGHFKFFHSLYEAQHPLLKDIPNVWELPVTDAKHPCYDLPVNPTAYEGRPNTIKDKNLRDLAWLGNLNYWSLVLLLDAGYKNKSKMELALAQTIMMGPIMSIAKYLPTKGTALPFDPLSMGFDPGLSVAASKKFTRRVLTETRDYARSIENLLPGDFNIKLYDQLLASVG